MQAEDWGQYSQAPWRTGRACKNTSVSNGPERRKAKQPTRVPTTKPAHDPSPDKTSHQEKAKCKPEVAPAELQFKLRCWTFAHSRQSNPPASGSPLSPRTRPSRPATPPSDGAAEEHDSKQEDLIALARCRVDTAARANPALDGHLASQYLVRCIAAVEVQLAQRGDRSKKRDAVREIERLVERVVTEADLGSERVGASVLMRP